MPAFDKKLRKRERTAKALGATELRQTYPLKYLLNLKEYKWNLNHSVLPIKKEDVQASSFSMTIFSLGSINLLGDLYKIFDKRVVFGRKIIRKKYLSVGFLVSWQKE